MGLEDPGPAATVGKRVERVREDTHHDIADLLVVAELGADGPTFGVLQQRAAGPAEADLVARIPVGEMMKPVRASELTSASDA